MKRRDLQALADIRLQEAQVLFQNRKFDGAYYLAGYAIECAIKACVAKKTQRFDFPDKGLATQVYTHGLTELLKPAGLAQVFKEEFRTDPARFGGESQKIGASIVVTEPIAAKRLRT